MQNPLLVPDKYDDGHYWVKHKNKSIHYAELVQFLTWQADNPDKTKMQLVYFFNKSYLTANEFLKEYEVLNFVRHPINTPVDDDYEEGE